VYFYRPYTRCDESVMLALTEMAECYPQYGLNNLYQVLCIQERFQFFNVVDNFNREALEIEIDLNIPVQRMMRVLDRIVANCDDPLKMRMENGHRCTLTPLKGILARFHFNKLLQY
jgi:hypothetical protein